VLPDAWEIIHDPTRGLPEALKPSLSSLCQEIVSLSTRIEEIEAQLEALAKQIPAVARLRTVQASACSRPPRYTPSSATSPASLQAATWQASLA